MPAIDYRCDRCWRILAVFVIALAVSSPLRAQQGIPLGSDRDEQHSAAIVQALDSRLSVHYQDTPLREVIASWRSQFGINIVVAEKQLADEGQSLDVPLSLEMNNIRFESLLNTIVDLLELDYVVRADHLLITTPDGAATPAKSLIRTYPVQDLVLTAIGYSGSYVPMVNAGRFDWPPIPITGHPVAADHDALIESIMSMVTPDSWSIYGGDGTIEVVPGAGCLVIASTHRVHRQVEDYLSALRTARDSQGIETWPPNTSQADGVRDGRVLRPFVNQMNTVVGGVKGPPSP